MSGLFTLVLVSLVIWNKLFIWQKDKHPRRLPLATFSKKKCKENWLSMPQVLAATFLALICTMQPNSFLETNPDSENTFDLAHYKGSTAQWLLLFPVDRDTHEFFCRLPSNVFDAASLFQTNDMLN